MGLADLGVGVACVKAHMSCMEGIEVYMSLQPKIHQSARCEVAH